MRDTEVKGKGNVNGFVRFIRIISNILWFPIGFGMTLAHIGIGLLYCITILGIPVGIVYLRMGKFIIFPLFYRSDLGVWYYRLRNDCGYRSPRSTEKSIA